MKNTNMKNTNSRNTTMKREYFPLTWDETGYFWLDFNTYGWESPNPKWRDQEYIVIACRNNTKPGHYFINSPVRGKIIVWINPEGVLYLNPLGEIPDKMPELPAYKCWEELI